MKIRAVSAKGVATVRLSADNLLLWAVFLSSAASHSLLSLLFLGAFVAALEGIRRVLDLIRLDRWEAEPLARDTSPALASIIDDECRAIGLTDLARSLDVRVIPRSRQATAFVMGGIRAKYLMVTGPFCVLAALDRETAAMIVRHELAHVRNGDSRLRLLSLSMVLFVPILLSFSRMRDISFEQVMVGLLLQLSMLAILFSRREYLADAIALNNTADRTRYRKLLDGHGRGRGGWLHPSREARYSATISDSPVLRINVLFVLLAIYVSLSGLANLQPPTIKYGLEATVLSSINLILGVLLAVVPALAALILELSKGFRRKIPAGKNTDNLTLDHSALRRSRLAELAGVGSEVNVAAIVAFAFVCALTIFDPFGRIGERLRFDLSSSPESILDRAVGMPSTPPSQADLLRENLAQLGPQLLDTFSSGTAWAALAFVFTLLLGLRSFTSSVEAGALAAIVAAIVAWCLYNPVQSSFPTLEVDPWTPLPLLFYAFIATVFVAAALRVIESSWTALLVGGFAASTLWQFARVRIFGGLYGPVPDLGFYLHLSRPAAGFAMLHAFVFACMVTSFSGAHKQP